MSLSILMSAYTIGFSQCNSPLNIAIDEENLSIVSNGFNQCQLSIPYAITNPNICAYSGFTLVFTANSPKGTDNILAHISSPIDPNTTQNQIIDFSSNIFFNDINNSCFNLDEITISFDIANFNPPTILIEEIICPFGEGTITVCQNDNNVICDDSQCIPYPCSTNVGVEVNENDFTIVENGADECAIRIPFTLTSSGTCDVGSFGIDFTLITLEGSETVTETVNGLTAGSNIAQSIIISSSLLENDGSCFDVNDIEVNAFISTNNYPEVISTTVPCPNGNGTIEICGNNQLLVCDESACIPWSCESNVELIPITDEFSISNTADGVCALFIPYNIINFGDCDVSGFSMNISTSTPEGEFNDIVSIPGPIQSGNSFSNNFLASSINLSSGGNQCYNLNEIVVTLEIIPNDAPQIITTTIPCPISNGTIEVCANNEDIICDDTNCDIVLAVAEEIIADATVKTNGINLSWIYNMEERNNTFSILHSQDGKDFYTLVDDTFMIEKGSYQYFHYSPYAGDNYYKIVSTGILGKEVSSNIIHEKYSTSKSYLYPNPANDKLTLISEIAVNAQIEIIDNQGRQVLEKQLSQKSSHDIDIKQLESGLYFLRINNDQKISVLKFIKL